MIYRIIGALFVFGGCGGFGFVMASSCRREQRQLHCFLRAVEFMLCELEYRATPLPQLCRRAAEVSGGAVGQVLQEIARRMELSLDADAAASVEAALANLHPGGYLDELFCNLGQTLGAFDLEGQRRGLESALGLAQQMLRRHQRERSSRVRSYQTLGLCAGAALAILFL